VRAAWLRRFTCRLGCNSRCVNALERRVHSTTRQACYNGFWFSPEREALQALVIETQGDVTGIVRLTLYKGNIIVAGRKSSKSLYDPKIATMEGDASSYDQTDATGFIRLNALQLRLRAALKR
jgi:argininosuccinate synthase